MLRKFYAEFAGTFLMIFFGCGVVHAATLLDSQISLLHIALVWGIAIALAIFITGAVSGGHLNPAMTLAFVIYRRHPLKEALWYWLGQFAGAFCAAAVLFALFLPAMNVYDETHNIVRGQPESVVTARCYGEYYSSPHNVTATEEQSWEKAWQKQSCIVPHYAAFLAEILGTAILAFVVFGLIDRRNQARPAAHLVPFFIGLTITILIAFIAPATQACFNPARDFAPRLFAFLAGWGSVAIPGPNGIGILTVYIIAPCLGSVLGGGLYDTIIRPAFPKEDSQISL